MRLVLASQSPRRLRLLRALGLDVEVVAADVDEDWHEGEDPITYVERVAADKADTVASRLDRTTGTVIVAADTTVDLDGEILAKPDDDGHARLMLTALSGRTHQVHTAVVAWTAGEVGRATVTTSVTFVDLTDELIGWYLSSGEHVDKAGAYGMQGAAGALVTRIDGSPSNVIGLPLAETVALLRTLGVHLGAS